MSTIASICSITEERPLELYERVSVIGLDENDEGFSFVARIEAIDHGYAKLRDDDGNLWSAALEFLVRVETTGEPA